MSLWKQRSLSVAYGCNRIHCGGAFGSYLRKGEELSGEYWPRIYRLFSNEHVGVGISGGDFHITQPQYLSPIYADCGHALEEIGKREADRQLDNRVKESNIKYARRAFWISVGALIVAATSLVWQLIQATA